MAGVEMLFLRMTGAGLPDGLLALPRPIWVGTGGSGTETLANSLGRWSLDGLFHPTQDAVTTSNALQDLLTHESIRREIRDHENLLDLLERSTACLWSLIHPNMPS
jgi:hypothetical protein